MWAIEFWHDVFWAPNYWDKDGTATDRVFTAPFLGSLMAAATLWGGGLSGSQTLTGGSLQAATGIQGGGVDTPVPLS